MKPTKAYCLKSKNTGQLIPRTTRDDLEEIQDLLNDQYNTSYTIVKITITEIMHTPQFTPAANPTHQGGMQSPRKPNIAAE